MFKVLISILLLLFLYHVREIFPPFIVGAIFAYLLYPLVKMVKEKLGWPPALAVLCIYIGSLFLIGYLAWHAWPELSSQASNLYTSRRQTAIDVLTQIAPMAANFGTTMDVEATADQVLDQLQSSIGKPEELVHVGGLIGQSLLSLLICSITSIYMLTDHQRVGRFFLRFIPSDRRATVVSLTSQMDIIFRKYVLGQLALIMLMSFVGFCILKAFNIRYALLLALFSGFLEIIPVLGPLLVYTVIFLFSFAQWGVVPALLVLGCFGIARLVEDYFVVPNTVGHAVELHPLATIFAVIVGEKMAGALGMLIAIPVAAAIKVIVDFCYPPTITEEHQEHDLVKTIKNFFKKPLTEAELREQQDALAIANMHESSTGSRAVNPLSSVIVLEPEIVIEQSAPITPESKAEPAEKIITATPAVPKATASTTGAAATPAVPPANATTTGAPHNATAPGATATPAAAATKATTDGADAAATTPGAQPKTTITADTKNDGAKVAHSEPPKPVKEPVPAVESKKPEAAAPANKQPTAKANEEVSPVAEKPKAESAEAKTPNGGKTPQTQKKQPQPSPDDKPRS